MAVPGPAVCSPGIPFFWSCSSFQHRHQIHATTHSKLHQLPLDTLRISLGTTLAPLPLHAAHAGKEPSFTSSEAPRENVNPKRFCILLLGSLNMFSSLFTALQMGTALALRRQQHQQPCHCLAAPGNVGTSQPPLSLLGLTSPANNYVPHKILVLHHNLLTGLHKDKW